MTGPQSYSASSQRAELVENSSEPDPKDPCSLRQDATMVSKKKRQHRSNTELNMYLLLLCQLFWALLIFLLLDVAPMNAMNATDAKEPAADAAKTPPMGWMSWERFRCNVDCTALPNDCINANLYSTMATRLVEDGYLEAGYNTISIDDCWMTHSRDKETQVMVADPQRFPSGVQGLASDIHSKGVRFGLYTDIGTNTCAGYEASFGFEEVDAKSYASWGVDYLKVDGCYANVHVYEKGYPKLGKALQQSGREITYSCSWPAYLGDDESKKPFDRMIDAGCNLWRNWWDIENNWKSVSTIIDHFGKYSDVLSTVAGPGHWNDMDMIMAGNDHGSVDGKPVLTLEQAKIQLSIWSIMASPLIMSNDLRTVPVEYRDILLNKDMIAVNQDPLGQAGKRVSKRKEDGLEIWIRPLSGNRVAVVLYNPNTGQERPSELDVSVDLLQVSETVWQGGQRLSGNVHVKNVWTGQYMEMDGSVLHAAVLPMSCLFLVVGPADVQPQRPVRSFESVIQ